MMRRLVRAPPRHPAARHRREHLARHHRDLHLCAGAVLGACRPLGRRRRDARQRAVPFRLHGAVRAAYRRRRRGRGGVGIARAISAWCRPSRPPQPARGGPRSNSTARRRSSRGCRSSSAPTIRPRCRCSWSRAPHADAMVTDVEIWSMRVSGWSAEAAARAAPTRRDRRGAGPRLRRRGAAGLGAGRRRARPTSTTRWSRPAHRCARRPSSAATRPAIRSPTRTSRTPAAEPEI